MDILPGLVHLDELPKGMGPETALDVVMCAVWGMLYVDNACTVPRSLQGIVKVMSGFVTVFGVCGLTVSKKHGGHGYADTACISGEYAD